MYIQNRYRNLRLLRFFMLRFWQFFSWSFQEHVSKSTMKSSIFQKWGNKLNLSYRFQSSIWLDLKKLSRISRILARRILAGVEWQSARTRDRRPVNTTRRERGCCAADTKIGEPRLRDAYTWIAGGSCGGCVVFVLLLLLLLWSSVLWLMRDFFFLRFVILEKKEFADFY